MKTIFKIALILTLSTGFLTACDRGKSKSSSGINDPYNPNGGSGGGNFPAQYSFSGRAHVVNRSVYREFLKGDFCYSKKRDCARIDGGPRITMDFNSLTLPAHEQLQSRIRLFLKDDKRNGYYQGSVAVANYLLLLRPLSGNTQFEGSITDRAMRGFGKRVQFIGTGSPASGGFRLQVLYDGELMLEGRLSSRR